MIFPPGNHLLRISQRSNANYGSAGGAASIDRPVQLDPWSGLPFIAESSEKGVIAGTLFGNAGDENGGNARRTEVFGSSDDNRDGKPFRMGKGAAVTFGDGELLCFPMPGRNGQVVSIFPARTLRRIAALPLTNSLVDTGVDLRPESAIGNVAAESLPAALATTEPGRIEGWHPCLLADLPTDTPFLIVGDDIAATLWADAVETRTLTSIDNKTAKVVSGSLRNVELVPADSVFVSLISNDASEAFDLALPEQLQLGAWEGTGNGFVALDWVLDGRCDTSLEFKPTTAASGKQTELRYLLLAEKCVTACEKTSYAASARSILREFGNRWRLQGLPATLAFSLGKAKWLMTFDPEKGPGPDVLAHRWLLATLFGHAADNMHISQPALYQRIVKTISGDQAAPPDMDRLVTWLRRRAETMTELAAMTEDNDDG